MNRIITDIIVKTGEEECRVDVDKLHEALLLLPAEKYIELYNVMKSKVEGKLFYNITEAIDYPGRIDWGKHAFPKERTRI